MHVTSGIDWKTEKRFLFFPFALPSVCSSFSPQHSSVLLCPHGELLFPCLTSDSLHNNIKMSKFFREKKVIAQVYLRLCFIAAKCAVKDLSVRCQSLFVIGEKLGEGWGSRQLKSTHRNHLHFHMPTMKSTGKDFIRVVPFAVSGKQNNVGCLGIFNQ